MFRVTRGYSAENLNVQKFTKFFINKRIYLMLVAVSLLLKFIDIF